MIWPALQARAFALVNIFNCAMVVVVVVVVRHTQKILPIAHAAASARTCCMWKFWICKCDAWEFEIWKCKVLDLQMQCLGILDLQM